MLNKSHLVPLSLQRPRKAKANPKLLQMNRDVKTKKQKTMPLKKMKQRQSHSKKPRMRMIYLQT